MQRRPWPLVLLALIQVFGPVGSILVSAHVNHIGFFAMAGAIWNYSAGWDIFELYGLPLLQGLLVFFAGRFGYYALLALASTSIALNFREWKLASDVISIPVLLAVTGTNLALIAYLLIPNVRAIFLNPRLRWWENPPRYLVGIKASVARDGEAGKPGTILDLSVGGAGIQTDTELFKMGDSLLVTFEHEGTTVLMRAQVVYGRADENRFRYGIEWRRGSEADEARTLRLLDDLEAKKVSTVRDPPQWKEDLHVWWQRAKKSPRAWIPEITTKKKG